MIGSDLSTTGTKSSSAGLLAGQEMLCQAKCSLCSSAWGMADEKDLCKGAKEEYGISSCISSMSTYVSTSQQGNKSPWQEINCAVLNPLPMGSARSSAGFAGPFQVKKSSLVVQNNLEEAKVGSNVELIIRGIDLFWPYFGTLTASGARLWTSEEFRALAVGACIRYGLI